MSYTTAEIVAFWLRSGERNWQIARDLFKLKRYDACLFFCHLALEKLLKGLVVRATKEPAPYIHDLAKLATLTKLQPTTEQTQHLRTIATFNVAARYDNIKLAFYKKCTHPFTARYLDITKQLILWLKGHYRKM
ncbi:MAG: HEPN domain-containing protein [Candidatus Magasanikbacteria bacterium]|nr:HEPN domain-containing protein [Candidatus Magasanikbacteria bacterium]